MNRVECPPTHTQARFRAGVHFGRIGCWMLRDDGVAVLIDGLVTNGRAQVTLSRRGCLPLHGRAHQSYFPSNVDISTLIRDAGFNYWDSSQLQATNDVSSRMDVVSLPIRDTVALRVYWNATHPLGISESRKSPDVPAQLAERVTFDRTIRNIIGTENHKSD